MIVDGMVEIDDGADEGQHQNEEQDDVAASDVLGVIGVVLWGHVARILLSPSERAAWGAIKKAGPEPCLFYQSGTSLLAGVFLIHVVCRAGSVADIAAFPDRKSVV